MNITDWLCSRRTFRQSSTISSSLLSFVACLSLVGCGSQVRTASYSVVDVQAKPPSLMVARKIQRPLYIVLDTNRVKDMWTLETSGCAARSYMVYCARIDLTSVQTFVRRDIKMAMEDFFSHVEVVDTSQALPDTPHEVANVKIDDIRFVDLQRGEYISYIIEMKWGFAMRLSEREDYAYSFAGTAMSSDFRLPTRTTRSLKVSQP